MHTKREKTFQMEQVKKTLFNLLQACIWLSFLCMLNDPGTLGPRPADSIYTHYAFLLNPLYSITGYLIFPVKWLFTQLGLYHAGQTGWFPMSSAPDFSQAVSPFGLSKYFTPTLFHGTIVWWIPLTAIALLIVSSLFDHFYEICRNWVWNVVIEYLFHRKKSKLYQKVLDEKSQEFERLNKEYRSLTQEAHSLKDSVITDELTKVFNKRFFLNRLQQEFDNCKSEKDQFCIIMIDIDFFKKLNDVYGHLAGDQVLKAVASVLKRFSPEQCYPCRYGGEEFSIIMPKRNLNDAIETARLIQENIQLLRFEDIDKKLRVTVSQGICAVDFNSSETKSLRKYEAVLELADQQLYRSKKEGRNRVSYHLIGGANAS